MGTVIRLEAIRKEGEILRADAFLRPDIVIPNGSESCCSTITLGKNSTTQIADPNLKRKFLQVSFDTKQRIVKLSKILEPGMVSVNGLLVANEHILENGDILALHTPSRAYEYKVVGDTTTTISSTRISSPPPPSVTSASEAPSHQQQQQQQQHPISDEFSCAMCLDLLVQTTTCVPCGHSFCHACVQKQQQVAANTTKSECMTCRSAIHSTVPCRALDNAIAAMVAMQQQQNNNNNGSSSSFFSDDDVRMYQQRKQQQQQQPTPSKKRKRAAGPSGGGGGAVVLVDGGGWMNS